MTAQDDEGVLDPWVAAWMEANPQPDWMTEGFPPDVRELARNYAGAPPTVHLDEVRDERIDGVPVRIYRDEGPRSGLVVYFHGGAFTVGSVNIMDNVAREIARASGAVVISVDYRLAPEDPYPAGLNDCETVTRWAIANAASFGVSPDAVAVGGESAGGNLATAVALRLRDTGLTTLAGQVLVYPCTDGPSVPYPSREQFGSADWVWEQYGGGKDLGGDPYALPMQADSLRGLPPALVLVAGCDGLRDEGRAYAGRLRADGVEVEEVTAAGQPHGFINQGFPAAAPAFEQIGGWLRTHLSAGAANVAVEIRSAKISGGKARFVPGEEMMRTRLLPVTLLLAVLVGLLSVAAGLRGPQASAAGSPLTIAYITSLTGPGAPEDAGSQAGFLARISLQNAEGGVNGHKLVPLVIDDQSNPSTVATGVQEALSKGVIGIVSNSGLFFLAAKYPQEQGVPVTGFFGDGPEWGEQPYTNMFASDHGSVDPKYPVNTLLGNFLKQHGGTVIASYGYSISPQSAAAARGNADSFKLAGGKVGVLNTTVALGSVDFTADALVAKQAGVDALAPSLDNNSNFALAQALEQAGVKLKSVLFATGYEPDIVHSTVWPSVQGDYFLSAFRPFALPNAGTEQMQAAMEKYAHFTKSQFPGFGEYESWLGADLMIKGIQMAGPNPTHAAIVKDLRSLKAYNGNGLLPITIDYSTIFGHDAPDCTWIMQAHKSGFTPVSSQPICGHDVAGTTTVAGS